MLKAVLMTVAALTIFGTACRKEGKGQTQRKTNSGRAARESSVSSTPANAPRLPVVRIEDVPSPKQPVVVFQRPLNVEGICREAFGSSNLTPLLLNYNDLKSADVIPAGRELKTPSIARMFQDAGADERYQPVFNVPGKVVADYNALIPDYREQRRAQQTDHKVGQIVMRPDTRDEFIRLAENVEACCSVLGEVKESHEVPRRTIDQLKQVAALYRQLSTGAVDSEGYDYGVAEQRIGYGLGNAMGWVKSGYR